ncbi:MAG: hypothetical protein GTO63_08925 [Anaerolineae bacterium]|nr:hypothetical protein [Anaerolineae bacterium]NIQ78049.1 hypothetical protein [Anaerolineae bacterium]
MMSILADLSDKEVDVESVASTVLENQETLSELLEGVQSRQDTIRYNIFKVLMILSEEHPELLYPNKWEFFADLLSSDNTYHRQIGMQIIASLTKVDTEKKFGELFEEYYGLLDDESVIPASHLAARSGEIARAKPELAGRITEKLLSIDETHHKPHRKELVKASAIEAFDEYFEDSEDQDKITEFVREQLDSESPKARKAARCFLNKWDTSAAEA